MRRLALAGVAMAAVVVAQPRAAQVPTAIEEVRRIASTGAADIALERVDREQPKQADAPTWVDWETIRVDLLASRERDAQVLARIPTYLAVASPGRAHVGVLTAAARVAQRSGEPAQARRLLARLFLATELTNIEYRAARLAVIDAYLAEGNFDAAYHSMLRFQQEFNPLRPEEAERFIAGLVEAERINEAASWLTRLDPTSLWSSLLRMRAGLLSPEAAIAQARSAIAKTGSDGAWALLAAAGRAQNNRAIAVEVAEHRLNAAGSRSNAQRSQDAEILWRLYSETAQQSANQAQLLSGDDAAWLAHAARISKSQPQLARAFAGHIALRGTSPTQRSDARFNLLAALRDAKLATTALRLYGDPQRFPTESMEARMRMELGHVAMDARQPELAMRYWHKLEPPSGATGAQWHMRYCAALVQARRSDEALALARSFLAAKPPPAPELLRPMIDVAGDALSRGDARLANALFAMLMPLVAEADRPAVWVGIARGHEANGEHRFAAAEYLNAATSVPMPDSDREALRAREAAAGSLLKAGLRDDARAVYDWLARNAKDAGIRESAGRMLRTLQ